LRVDGDEGDDDLTCLTPQTAVRLRQPCKRRRTNIGTVGIAEEKHDGFPAFVGKSKTPPILVGQRDLRLGNLLQARVFLKLRRSCRRDKPIPNEASEYNRDDNRKRRRHRDSAFHLWSFYPCAYGDSKRLLQPTDKTLTFVMEKVSNYTVRLSRIDTSTGRSMLRICVDKSANKPFTCLAYSWTDNRATMDQKRGP
jgi:hypothetical protein